MTILSTWLKQAGTAFFAALLLCLTIVPTFDSMVCASEAPAAAGVMAGAGDQFAVNDKHGDGSHRDSGGDACIHGHCHQTSAPAAPIDTQLAEVSIDGVDLKPAETGLPPSRAPEGPMEPPRA
jgi:hypothetical protein